MEKVWGGLPFLCTKENGLHIMKERGGCYVETMQKDVFAIFGRASAAGIGAGDTACLYPSLWSSLSGAVADMRRWMAPMEPINLPQTKKSRSFHWKRMAFGIRRKLDCACYFVGTHTSCANINRFDVAVSFNDFYFFYIGFPFSICSSGYLGTFDTDSMTCNLAFLTNCTFSHLSHLLQTCLCDITKIF